LSQQVLLAERALSVFTEAPGWLGRGGEESGFASSTRTTSATRRLSTWTSRGTRARRSHAWSCRPSSSPSRRSRRVGCRLTCSTTSAATDATYAAEDLNNALYNWPRNGWTTREGAPVLNADLWKELTREYRKLKQQRLRVEITWRKGHSASNPHNKVADKLAKQSAGSPLEATRVAPVVRRKKSMRTTERGSELMLGQERVPRLRRFRVLRQPNDAPGPCLLRHDGYRPRQSADHRVPPRDRRAGKRGCDTLLAPPWRRTCALVLRLRFFFRGGLRYANGRRGQVVADAHVDDEVVKQIARVGKQQARRGRRPKESQ
jgi:RNase H